MDDYGLPCEQRLHFRGMRWRAKSNYFSHASSFRENVASARRVTTGTRFDFKFFRVFSKYGIPGKLHFTIFY